jgi:hypothetical protein
VRLTLEGVMTAVVGLRMIKPPAPPELPGTSWINPPQDKETGTQ